MIKTGVNVMYKFLSIIDYQTYLKFAINEKNRKEIAPDFFLLCLDYSICSMIHNVYKFILQFANPCV